MTQRNSSLWILAAVLLTACAARAQSVIELRASAAVAPGTPVTLGQIARLEGPEAEALAGVEVAPSAGRTVGIEEVRHAINASGRTNWGRISLRGATCRVVEQADAPRPAAAKAAPAPIPATPGPDTVRAAIGVELGRYLKVGPEDLQLTFAPEDGEYLNTSTAGRSVEIHAAGLAERIPLRIAVYDKDRIVGGERTVRVGVKVRREVLIAAAVKRKGDTFAPEDISTESRWIAPTIQPAAADQVLGAAVRNRVNAGEIIETDDVAPAVVVNKGDIIAIRCVSGGVVLATRGRALTPGRDGDVIEFQAMDSKRRFFARLDGKGRAVAAAAPTGDGAPRQNMDRSRPASLPVRGGTLPPPISPETSR